MVFSDRVADAQHTFGQVFDATVYYTFNVLDLMISLFESMGDVYEQTRKDVVAVLHVIHNKNIN